MADAVARTAAGHSAVVAGDIPVYPALVAGVSA